jgi:predicted O-methyltransferase YrrM
MNSPDAREGELDLETIRAQIEVVSLSVAAWRAQVLYTGVKVGLFECLAKGTRTIEELSRELGCPVRSLERLVIAAHAMHLLEREGSSYSNSKAAARTLVPGQAGYVGNWIRLTSQWFKPWSNLEQAVRTGQHVEDPSLHLGATPEYNRDFIRGMHDYANSRGRDLLRYLDLSGARRLLDVGGGPGTYSIIFARKHPELRCTVFDLPEVVKIAAEYVAAAGLQDRVTVQAGDYCVNEFGSDYDVAFLSDMLQQEDPDTALMVLEKAYRALRSGGRIVVQAMFLKDDNSGPEWPALHNLMLLLISRHGKALTMAETIRWIERAGFVDVQRVPMSFFNANSLIVARRP